MKPKPRATNARMPKTRQELKRVRVSGEIINLPISELAERSAQVLKEMGPETEAIVTRNKETIGVFMSVERRNVLAEAEENLHAALLHIDMLAAGRSFQDVERSAEDVKQGRGISAQALLEQLENR